MNALAAHSPSSFVVRRSSFVVRRSSFVFRRSAFVVRCGVGVRRRRRRRGRRRRLRYGFVVVGGVGFSLLLPLLLYNSVALQCCDVGKSLQTFLRSIVVLSLRMLLACVVEDPTADANARWCCTATPLHPTIRTEAVCALMR